MLKTAAALLTLSLTLGFAACKSHEHPQEHPEEGQKKEHPEEHPQGSKGFDLKKDYTAAVSGHIGDRAKTDGAFNVLDKKLKKEWNLDLIRIHNDKIVSLGKDRYFACADFKDHSSDKVIDLDFYATWTAKGWEIEPALIHKVEGVRRYTYNSKNERVPAKGK